MEKVYEYQNDGHLIICGDLNARVGQESDYIEGVDDVKPREVIDDTVNRYGDHFLDFLINCNFCMLNGRLGTNDFTHISKRGRSVVDYVCVPHEQYANYSDFSVQTMTDISNTFNLYGYKMSDHSVLLWTQQPMKHMPDTEHFSESQENVNRSKKFVLNDIPASFLNCEESLQAITDTVNKIEKQLMQEQNITDAYQSFINLVQREMELKLKKKPKVPLQNRQHKSRVKKYWSTELQVSWDKVSVAEKRWLKFKGSTASRNKLRAEYCSLRHEFDKMNRRAKRAHQSHEQQKLYDKLYNTENPRDFWTQIGKIGISNDRKTSIPFEVIANDNTVKTDYSSVLGKWKTDYEQLYNYECDSNTFDNQNLQYVKECVKNQNSGVFPRPDCSSLNLPITYEEVHKAVYEAKLRKASGIDNIPSEILRNEVCINLLFRIIRYSFENCCIPSEWAKGIIKPLLKGDDPRNPMNYRPITIISIPCKIYANILNNRLVKWLECNKILTDVKNGFRKDRSCQDHVYSLYNIVRNRKIQKKDTFACFVDMKKAFDTVQRDCMWYKLLSVGIHGNILRAIQSLYKDVSCTVSINNCLTEWFPVRQGLKQGCGMSPTLFAIYINDLAEEISRLNCGIDLDSFQISILLYADDIVLLTESEGNMQKMLNVLHVWCSKWRLAVNESKTRVLHFRNKTRLRSNYVFKCGEKNIVFEKSYKYLGFWFNEFLDMDMSVTEITKSASRALGAVYMKYQYAGGMAYDVYKKLVESIVEPVLFYCSGIWGNRKYTKVEGVLNKACRYFLGVSKNAPNLSSKGDMGWASAEVKQKLETVRLWCRLRNMPSDRTVHKIHSWSFQIGKSWENNMLKLIESLNIRDYMLAQNPSKAICLKLARDKLTELDYDRWKSQLLQNGINVDNGNKLRTYRTYKNNFSTETYVKSNMRRDHRRILARFRSCNLPLAVETGRYTKPKTPIDERLCKYCDESSIEDETHFLIECELYSDIRYDLFQIATAENRNFPSFSTDEKLVYLMQSDSLLYKLASSLLKMSRRRRVFAH